MYRIEFARKAGKFYKRIDAVTARRLNKIINKLTEDSLKLPNTKHLQAELAGSYWIRMGIIRLVKRHNSPRRMGKSSLLSVVTARLESLGMVCGCIDFFGLKSASKIVSETVRVCAEIISRQESDLKRFLATITGTFKRTRIAIEPSPDGSGFSIKPEITLPVAIRTSLAEYSIECNIFQHRPEGAFTKRGREKKSSRPEWTNRSLFWHVDYAQMVNLLNWLWTILKREQPEWWIVWLQRKA